jgi:hypothetical protein
VIVSANFELFLLKAQLCGSVGRIGSDRRSRKYKWIGMRNQIQFPKRICIWNAIQKYRIGQKPDHDPHVTQVKGKAHEEAQEGDEAHQIDQHEQEFVMDALRNARSCSGCSPCTS